jgi:hypothetical protein
LPPTLEPFLLFTVSDVWHDLPAAGGCASGFGVGAS